MKKLISTILSFILVFGAHIPSFAQNIEGPRTIIYYYVGDTGVFESPTLVSKSGERAFVKEYMELMDESSSYLKYLIADWESDFLINKMPNRFSTLPATATENTAKLILSLELNAQELKKISPDVLEYGFSQFPGNKFLQNLSNGMSVKDAFVRDLAGGSNPQMLARADELFEFARGKQGVGGIVNEEFVRAQFKKVSYRDLERSLMESDEVIKGLKKSFQALGVMDQRVQAVVLSELSQRAAVRGKIGEPFKEALLRIDRELAAVEAEFALNPKNKVMQMVHRGVLNKKAYELKRAFAALEPPLAAEIEDPLTMLYKKNGAFKSAVTENAVGAAERQLLKNISKEMPSPKIRAAGVITLFLVVAGVALTAGGGDVSADGKLIADNYKKFLSSQRVINDIVDHASAALPILYSKADSSAKKMMTDFAFKDDATAERIYLISSAFAYEAQNMTKAQLTQKSALAAKAIAEEESAGRKLVLEGKMDRFEDFKLLF